MLVDGDGSGGETAVAAALLADEAAGVEHDFVSGGGVEVAAAGVLDARVVGHGGGFTAARDLDAFGWRLVVDVLEVEAEIAFELTELALVGKPDEGVFAGDFGECDGAFDELGEAVRAQVG